MRDKQLNDLFINLLRSKIPDDKKIAAILSEILVVHKEVVYRRLRNEVVFTFSEITQISYSLPISLDHIVGMEKISYFLKLLCLKKEEAEKCISSYNRGMNRNKFEPMGNDIFHYVPFSGI